MYSFLLSLHLLFHPVHVSVTEINFSEKDEALQIATRIFIDDLELTIRNDLNSSELDLLKPGNGMTTDKLVSAYLKDHFKVKVDGVEKKQDYLGHEIEGLAIICYIEIPGIKKLKSVEAMNNVIMETHSDQSNLVHVTYQGTVRSVRLTIKKQSEILTFEQ